MTKRTLGTTRAMTLAMTVAIAAGAASAQQRIDTSGRALDANNRLGSGGFNSPRESYTPINAGNALVTGNVTGGAEFRGSVPYGDPRAFRGTLAGAGIDRFVRSSAGPTPVQGMSNAQTRRMFYGDSRGVAPPPGFQQIAATGGHIPAPPPARIGSDLRLGLVYDYPMVNLPRPGELLLPGPLDTKLNSRVISASPLYGIRALNSGDPGDAAFMQRYTNAFANAAPMTQTEVETVDRLRDEMTNTLGTSDGSRETTLNNAALDNTMSNQPMSGDPLSTDLRSGQAARQQMQLPAAVKQSTQYRDMVERLQRFNESQGVDPNVAASREYNAARRAAEAAKDAAQPPQMPQPNAAPDGAPALPGADAVPALPGMAPADPNALPGQPVVPGQLVAPTRLTEKPKPPMITSLATGMQSKGMEQLLQDAESLMREQKFVQAIDKYGTAQQAAPNNPLPLLGMAHAELGAGFYARAETHLRQAFGDQALLMAQYDLRQFLGDDRLAFVVKELKEIANTERESPRPLVLLAYIAYNDGNDRMAAGYLDLAEKRAGGDADGFYAKLRKFWQLPAVGDGDTDLNK